MDLPCESGEVKHIWTQNNKGTKPGLGVSEREVQHSREAGLLAPRF